MSKWIEKIKVLHNWCNKHEILLWILILLIALRIPSLVMPHYYGDEEIYFVMGRAWREGVPLYKAMFDHKPPLIYIMAGIAPSMLAFRGLLALWMIGHTVLFYKLCRLMWSKTNPKLVYVSTAIFAILTTLPTLEGLTVNAELLMMMPVTWAAIILWKAKDKEWVKYTLAGLLGGIAWLFKIPVAADMAALGLYFFVFKKASLKEAVKAIFSWSFLGYASAFVAPLALTFVYYYLKGTGPDYLATVLTVNLGYVSSWSTSTYTFNPFRSGLVVRGTILAIGTLLLYIFRKKIDKNLLFASLWTGFALFGALLSARPYPHYLQEVVPAISLLIPSIFVVSSLINWIVIGSIVMIAILVQKQINFWGYPTISVYQNYWQYLTKKINWDEYIGRFDNASRNYRIADYLNKRLGSDDKIYLWSTDPTVYNLTNKLPSGGKYIVSFHVRDLKKYDYTLSELEMSKPKYIVIMPGPTDFPELMSLIGQKYVFAETIDGADLYIRL